MKKPNILYIQYDQQRYDCVSMTGKYPVRTPNLERIANNGAFFTKAYTPIPVCAPARQALFSGRRPEAAGGLWNPHIVFPVGHIDAADYSWTRAVHDSGYATGYVGCWEVNPDAAPSDYGFERFVSRGEINKYVAEHTPAGAEYKNGFFGDANPVPLEDSFTHQVARHAIAMLRDFTASGKPFYIHLDSPEPHLPCRPSAPFDTMYDPDKIPAWDSIGETFDGKPYIQRQQLYNWELENRTWNEWKRTAAMYYGIISQYDDAVGRILDELDRLGETENTIIIYATDHGDMCGGHRLIDKHYNMYEDITHVPLAIRWDGHISPQRYTGYVQTMLDLPATLMGLLGMDVPEGKFQGADLTNALIRGEHTDGRDFAVSTYNGQQFGLFCERMIVTEGYKYVWNLTDTDEFYDHASDPAELKNEIHNDKYTEIIAGLRKKLYGELERCYDPIIGWNKKQLLEGRKL
ncbi:MAG: sulfatase-like hydrolase/transferase [Eubacteriales bacterium]